MKDKVQKIREEVEKLKSQLLRGACSSQIAMETMCKEEAYNEVLAILDTMQEEPVKIKKGCKYRCLSDMVNKDTGNISFVGDKIYLAPEDNTLVSEENGWLCDTSENASNFELVEEPGNIWHDGCEIPKSETNILMFRKDEKDSNYPPIAGCFHGTNSRLDGRNWGYYNGFCYNEIEPPVKWAYIDDILNLSNVQRTTKDWKEPVSEELEKAAKDYSNNLDNIYGSIGQQTRNAFKAGANWQKQQFEKNRLKHCNSITEEQYNLEVGFIDSHIDKYNRMPTFLDAIEYGMELRKQEMIKDAVEIIIKED